MAFKTRVLPQKKETFEVSKNGMEEEEEGGGGQGESAPDGVQSCCDCGALPGSQLPDLTFFHTISETLEILNIYVSPSPDASISVFPLTKCPENHGNRNIDTGTRICSSSGQVMKQV